MKRRLRNRPTSAKTRRALKRFQKRLLKIDNELSRRSIFGVESNLDWFQVYDQVKVMPDKVVIFRCE